MGNHAIQDSKIQQQKKLYGKCQTSVCLLSLEPNTCVSKWMRSFNCIFFEEKTTLDTIFDMILHFSRAPNSADAIMGSSTLYLCLKDRQNKSKHVRYAIWNTPQLELIRKFKYMQVTLGSWSTTQQNSHAQQLTQSQHSKFILGQFELLLLKWGIELLWLQINVWHIKLLVQRNCMWEHFNKKEKLLDGVN